MKYCRHAAADRHTHTDARDYNTFRVVYDCSDDNDDGVYVAGDSGRGGQGGSHIAAGAVPCQAAGARTPTLDARARPASAARRLGRGHEPRRHADAAVHRRQEDRQTTTNSR